MRPWFSLSIRETEKPEAEVNPGDSQSNVDSEISQHWSNTTPSSTGLFNQSETHKRELLFPSLLLSLIFFFSFQIRVRIIILSPLGKKQTGKTKKAAAGRASSYLSISSCLCLPPPHLSFSFLSASPLLWGNHVDLYEIWSVSAKNKRTAHSVSCPPSLSVLCCNPPSCSPSPIFISPSYLHLSLHITPSTSLPPSPSPSIHFWWRPSGLSLINGSLP